MSARLEEALQEFDRLNSSDPRTQAVAGKAHPRELVFAQRVYAWVERLEPSASEAVRLAARSHTLRRWEVPRGDYPMNPAGYHQWRAATAAHSAHAAAEILARLGYPDETVRRVSRLITWELFPNDPDAQLLEDADCLAFLEIKLEGYLTRWDEGKVRRILQGTWAKMSPQARRAAAAVPLDSRAKRLIEGL